MLVPAVTPTFQDKFGKLSQLYASEASFPFLDADWPGPYILSMLWSCWNCWSCWVFLWLGKIRKWCRKHAEGCGKTLGLQGWWGKGRLFSNPTFLFLFLLSLNLLTWPATCNWRNPDVIYEGHCQSCQVTCVMLEVHVQPAWWHTHLIPAIGRQMQKAWEFKAFFGYIASMKLSW